MGIWNCYWIKFQRSTYKDSVFYLLICFIFSKVRFYCNDLYYIIVCCNGCPRPPVWPTHLLLLKDASETSSVLSVFIHSVLLIIFEVPVLYVYLRLNFFSSPSSKKLASPDFLLHVPGIECLEIPEKFSLCVQCSNSYYSCMKNHFVKQIIVFFCSPSTPKLPGWTACSQSTFDHAVWVQQRNITEKDFYADIVHADVPFPTS